MYKVSDVPPSTLSPDQRLVIRRPEDLPSVLRDLYTTDRESFMVVFVDSQHRVINVPYLVSLGSLNASLVHPREVFREAIRVGACALIMAHNHPSGDTRPSGDDLLLTERLSKAGDILGIQVLDHVIVAGEADWTSLREYGWPL